MESAPRGRADADALRQFLARLVLDRTALCLPGIVVAMVICLVASQPLGVDLHGWAFAVNTALAVVAVAMAVAVRRGRVPDRLAHEFGAATWLISPAATLVTQAQTHMGWQAMLLMLELAGAGLQVSTGWFIASTALAIGAWIPLGIRDGGDLAGFQVGVMIGGGVLAYFVHLAMKRSVIRAETARLEERAASAAMAVELAERKQAEREREEIREQFVHAQRLEAVGTLASGLAHDMNNILASILGIADLLQHDDELAVDRVREDCQSIVAEAQRGAALTRSLLAFSRRGQYRRRPVKLADVVEPVRALLARTLPKSVAIVQRGRGDLVVDVDPAQLGQVVVNLCLNARDAMKGTGTLTIAVGDRRLDDAEADRLGLARGGSWATIAVTDTGCGMDDATRRRVFEPFFTTKPLGKGTGLGLAMAYGAAQGHGGTIDVDTTPGAGSTFTVYLPACAASPTDSAVRVGPVRVDPGPELVLVVDDEPMVRRSATRMLEALGKVATEACDGAEAIRVYEAHKDEIALVVLDMSMPTMGGADCFRELRKRGEVPILLVSGYAPDGEVQGLVGSGRAGFLEKPYTSAELAIAVARLARRGAATAAPT